ncbi:MAG: glycosyltransferase, partial [Actinomycetota bacterium]
MKIGVLVVAYEASATLEAVLNRIPYEFRPQISVILVCDDASSDDTYQVGVRVKEARPDLPLEVIRRPVNLGYGGNQKAGYRWMIDHEIDIV